MTTPPPPRILIADDEAAVCLIASRVLQMKGYSITTVTAGADVLQQISTEPDGFALLLLDLSMPPPSGAELIAAVREHAPDLAIVLMSGFDEHSAMSRAPGATAFLQKPFRGPDLIEIAARFISSTAP